MHIVGPGGRFGDALSTLSSRSGQPFFGGEVFDDFDGLGPEVVTIGAMAEGVYGVVVEPVFDNQDSGATAFLRLLFDGRLVTPAPIGPQYLSSKLGKLWIAGTLTVSGGGIEWAPLGDEIDGALPPTTAPDQWPSYYTNM